MSDVNAKAVVDEIETIWRTDWCSDHDHTGLPGDYTGRYLEALVGELRENAAEASDATQLRELAISYASQAARDFQHVADHMEARDE